VVEEEVVVPLAGVLEVAAAEAGKSSTSNFEIPASKGISSILKSYPKIFEIFPIIHSPFDGEGSFLLWGWEKC
jgi:hypothetical protein